MFPLDVFSTCNVHLHLWKKSVSFLLSNCVRRRWHHSKSELWNQIPFILETKWTFVPQQQQQQQPPRGIKKKGVEHVSEHGFYLLYVARATKLWLHHKLAEWIWCTRRHCPSGSNFVELTRKCASGPKTVKFNGHGGCTLQPLTGGDIEGCILDFLLLMVPPWYIPM